MSGPPSFHFWRKRAGAMALEKAGRAGAMGPDKAGALLVTLLQSGREDAASLVRRLLETSPEAVHAIDRHGYSVLHLGIVTGDVALVRTLVVRIKAARRSVAGAVEERYTWLYNHVVVPYDKALTIATGFFVVKSSAIAGA